MSDHTDITEPTPTTQPAPEPTPPRGFWSGVGSVLNLPDWTGVMFLALAGIMLGAMVLGSGCDTGDMIKVRPPASVVGGDVKPVMSLNDAIAAYEQWKAAVVIEDRQWFEKLGKGVEVQSVLGSLISDGMAYAAPALGGLPGGALIVGALTGIGGLLLPKPGTQKRIDAAYDMGRADARTDA